MNIDYVQLISGEKAPLRAVKGGSGGSHTGAMTGAIVATSILFFPAAPFFLFMHGKDITIPKGTEITAYINGNAPLDAAKLGLQRAQPQPITATAPAPASLPIASAVPQEPVLPAPTAVAMPLETEPATVNLKSTPDGADITIDGKFVGSTPSTIRLSPGDHQIAIQKAGSSAAKIPGGEVTLPTYRIWKRTLTLSPGNTITIDATLKPMR